MEFKMKLRGLLTSGTALTTFFASAGVGLLASIQEQQLDEGVCPDGNTTIELVDPNRYNGEIDDQYIAVTSNGETEQFWLRASRDQGTLNQVKAEVCETGGSEKLVPKMSDDMMADLSQLER